MADINNSFTIDAAQAIKTLNTLNTTLAATNRSLRVFQSIANSNMGGGFTTATQSLRQMEAAGRSATTAIRTGSRDAAQSVRGMGLSWQDVTRIVASQVLFSAITAVKQGFTESAEAAREFELSLLRVKAIAEGTDETIAGIEGNLDRLAIATGRDLSEVTEAAFEALQNDLGTTAETFALLENQGQSLALVTGGTLVQSVNALSSVMKSYAQSQEEAANNSKILFGTINAGRITLADLENSLGTILPLSSKAGVSFKDVSTALATVTLSGTKANVATTQLRNVFNKLIKPTELLQARFEELGFSNFQNLYADAEKRGLNFAEALNEITKNKTPDEIARMFNTIRGNLGVLNTLANKGTLFADTLDNVNDSGERLVETIGKFKDSDAFKSNQEFAKLDVLLKDVGKSTIVLQTEMLQLFGAVVNGADDVRVGVGGITTAITAATAATIIFRNVTAGAAFGIAGAFLAGGAAGLALVNAFDQAAEAAKGINDEVKRAEFDKLDELNRTLREGIPKAAEKAVAALTGGFEITDAFADATREANKLRKSIADITNDSNRDFGGILASFGDQRAEIIKSLGTAIDQLNDKILEDSQKIKDVQRGIFDFQFERSTKGLTEVEKLQAEFTRAKIELENVDNLIKNLDLSEATKDAAVEANKIAVGYAKATLASADSVGNVEDIKIAEEQVNKALIQQTKIYERINQLRGKESVADLEAQRNKLNTLNQKQLDDAKELKGRFARLQELSASGRSSVVASDLAKVFQYKLDEFKNKLTGFSDAEITKLLGFDEAAKQLETRVQEGLDRTVLDFSSSVDSLREQLRSEKFDAVLEFNTNLNDILPAEVRKLIGRKGDTGADPVKQLQTANDVVKEFNQTQLEGRGRIEAYGRELDLAAKKAREFAYEAGSQGFFDDIYDMRAVGQITVTPLSALNQLETANLAELRSLYEKVREARNQFESDNPKGANTSLPIFGNLFQEGEHGVDRFDALTNLFDQTLKSISAKIKQSGLERDLIPVEQLQEFNNELQQLNVPDLNDQGLKAMNEDLKVSAATATITNDEIAGISGSAQSADGSVATLTSTTGSLGNAAASAAQQFTRMAKAARDAAAAANAANNSDSSGFAFRGGQVNYRANGGDSRGQDTLPTMLSPEEFVMNSKSSRNFLPQLQAMNASTGSQAMGGDQNITIGDINVTSNSQLPSQTAREVGISIKRELRRGTFKL